MQAACTAWSLAAAVSLQYPEMSLTAVGARPLSATEACMQDKLCVSPSEEQSPVCGM